MSDTSDAFHAFGHDPDSTFGSHNPAGWVPTPWEQLAADLAVSHPHYQITGFINQGGMGAVYKAIDKDGSLLAIKVLRWDALDSTELKARFQKEILTIRHLDHPHIVPLLDSGETVGGVPFFVMPRYQGRTLEYYTKGPRLPVPRALRLMEQLCGATAYSAENGVVHRDLKPANIFLVDPDESARILDYGVARTLSRTEGVFTRTGMIAGTVGYQAPEVLAGRPAGTTADVFSLGLILYKLLTGTRPEGIPAPVSDYGHDPRFDPILAKALRPDPADRFQTATAFSEALRPLSQIPPASPPPLPPDKPKWYARKRILIPAAVVVISCLSIALGTTGGPRSGGSAGVENSNLELRQKAAVARIEGLERELSNEKSVMSEKTQQKSLLLMERKKFETDNQGTIVGLKLIDEAAKIYNDKTGKYTQEQKNNAQLIVLGGAGIALINSEQVDMVNATLRKYTASEESYDQMIREHQKKITAILSEITDAKKEFE